MFDDALQQNLCDLDAFLAIRELNRNDRVAGLITECLDLGSLPGAEVVARLGQLSFDRKHVGITLKGGPWRRSDDGLYHLDP